MSIDLKPCPWCGTAARLLGDGHGFTDEDGQLVSCTAAVCNNDQCQATGPFLASAEQAAQAWNDIAKLRAMMPKLLTVAETARSCTFHAGDCPAGYSASDECNCGIDKLIAALADSDKP